MHYDLLNCKISLVSLPVSFSGLGANSKYHIVFCFHVSFHLLWSATVFQSFIVFQNFDGFEEYRLGILENVPEFRFVLRFSHDWTRVMDFGGEYYMMKCSSHHIVSGGPCY